MAQSGKVKWYNDKLGYGFIECPGSEDVFVHHAVVRGVDDAVGLRVGDAVEFDSREGERGPLAEWVARAAP